MRTSVTLSLLAACGLGAASYGVVAATPQSDVPMFSVHYTDLDLSTDQGVRELYRRISMAASRVCPSVEVGRLTETTQVATCRAEAISKAVKAINNAHLAEIAAGKTHAG